MPLAPRIVQVLVGPPGAPGRLWQGSSAGGGEGLYIEFDVEQSKGKFPNRGEARIWNLSRDSLAFLELPGNAIQILAGETFPSVLYRGDVERRGVSTSVSPPDQTTTIAGGSGRLAFRDGVYGASFPPGASSAQILAEIFTVLAGRGLVLGYLDPTIAPKVYPSGYYYTGTAQGALDEVLADVGAEWSIQQGVLEVFAAGSAVPGQAVLVSALTGMRATPERTDKGISVQTTLTPAIRPSRIVRVDSVRVPSISGFYRATKSSHRGNSRGTIWETDFEAVPI